MCVADIGHDATLLVRELPSCSAKDKDELELQGGRVYLTSGPAATSHRGASRPRVMAELDPDQDAALRRLRAAFGFVEILRIVDHDQAQHGDEPSRTGSSARVSPMGQEPDATEQPSETTAQRLLELLPAGSGSVGGALVGLALGGPAGAIAGAAVEPVLEAVVSETLARRRARGQRALAVAAAEAAIAPEELLQRILRDERLLDLAAAVVAAASETMLESKIRTLGRALATGVLAADNAVVDEQRFLVDTLAVLEAPHLRVLHQLSIEHEGYGSATSSEGRRRAYGWSIGDLSAQLPGLTLVLRPVLRILAGRELILDTAVGTLDYVAGEAERWVVTEFGRRCLALLEERGREDLEDGQ
jgi:hypothetical protein